MDTAVNGGTAFDSTRQPVDFELREGLDLLKVMQMQRDWMTDFYLIIDKFKFLNPSASNKDIIQQCNVEDGMWNWVKKASVLNSDEYLWFSLERNASIESIIVIYHPKKSLLSGEDIFYVDFFAVAPWNRKSSVREPQYSGLGSLMLKLVGQHINSVYGYHEGFSLHSLPNALGFYTRIGMSDFGVDSSKENLHYLEMESSKARRFYHE